MPFAALALACARAVLGTIADCPIPLEPETIEEPLVGRDPYTTLLLPNSLPGKTMTGPVA